MRIPVLALAAGLLAVGCQLDKSEPPPVSGPSEPTTVPTGKTSPTPTPVLGLPAAAPTSSPSPDASPTPATGATPGPGASGCGAPVPPDLSRINVVVHLRGGDAWTLDSTPLVGPTPDYCAKIGFTDGRSYCPVRPEGNPERVACETYVTGKAKDTGRPGPTWYFNGSLCGGRASGCENSPDNQYQLLIYTGGTFQACAQNGVCGEVAADR